METYEFFLRIATLALVAGFGFRVGWKLVEPVETMIAYIVAFPYWLFLVARFRWRHRHQ